MFLLSAAFAAAPPAAAPGTAADPSPSAAELPDVPYSWEMSALAQRYYGQCRAEAKLRSRIVRDFNERHLTEPPFRSFRNKLSPADRRDADLVCLGAAFQELDDSDRDVVAPPPPIPRPRRPASPPASAAPAPAKPAPTATNRKATSAQRTADPAR